MSLSFDENDNEEYQSPSDFSDDDNNFLNKPPPEIEENPVPVGPQINIDQVHEFISQYFNSQPYLSRFNKWTQQTMNDPKDSAIDKFTFLTLTHNMANQTGRNKLAEEMESNSLLDIKPERARIIDILNEDILKEAEFVNGRAKITGKIKEALDYIKEKLPDQNYEHFFAPWTNDQIKFITDHLNKAEAYLIGKCTNFNSCLYHYKLKPIAEKCNGNQDKFILNFMSLVNDTPSKTIKHDIRAILDIVKQPCSEFPESYLIKILNELVSVNTNPSYDESIFENINYGYNDVHYGSLPVNDIRKMTLYFGLVPVSGPGKIVFRPRRELMSELVNEAKQNSADVIKDYLECLYPSTYPDPLVWFKNEQTFFPNVPTTVSAGITAMSQEEDLPGYRSDPLYIEGEVNVNLYTEDEDIEDIEAEDTEGKANSRKRKGEKESSSSKRRNSISTINKLRLNDQ